MKKFCVTGLKILGRIGTDIYFFNYYMFFVFFVFQNA